MKEGTLIVTEVNLNHRNHRLDKQTFDFYPENLRLKREQKDEVKKMIALGVNKQKLKAQLMKENNRVISLKVLHNIQTKQRLLKEGNNRETELKQLLEELQKVPNARIRVFTNEENELIGIFIVKIKYYFG